MELSNISKQTFQGIRIGCRVPEPVKDAVQRSEILQKLGKSYDVSIDHYNRNIHDKSLGYIKEYGLKYRIKEITPNLFNKKCTYNKKYISEYAMPLNSSTPRIGIRKQQKEEIISDLVTEIDSLTKQDIKTWFG